MEKEKLENQIIEYIDGYLNADERANLEAEFARNSEANQLYEQLKAVMRAMDKSASLEPSPQLKSSFEKALREEIKSKPQGQQIFFQPILFRAAAAVVFVLSGIAIGFWIKETNKQKEEMLALRREVQATKHIMQSMLDNTSSASQRLQGVNVALQMQTADDEVVKALVKVMNQDASSNVRLAALDALSKFQTIPEVRTALIQSLSTQKDPIVQIALIQLLVRMKEKDVMKDLERMVEDEQNIKAVKDEAYNGILKLS